MEVLEISFIRFISTDLGQNSENPYVSFCGCVDILPEHHGHNLPPKQIYNRRLFPFQIYYFEMFNIG
jgi:hypothetical protein